jgi:hypothetical protein
MIVALLIFPQHQKQNTKSKTAMPHSPYAMAPGKDTEWCDDYMSFFSTWSHISFKQSDRGAPWWGSAWIDKKDEWPPQSPIAILWIIMCMWDSLSEIKVFGATLKNSQRRKLCKGWLNTITGKKYILLNLHVESPLDRGKRDFGPFVEKTKDQSIIFSPRLNYMYML